MEFRKEKNVIIATENDTIKGRYDWADGIFYGAKGTPIKTIPVAFKDDTTYRSIINSHQRIINNIIFTTQARELALHRWECLASLELYADDIRLLADATYDFPALKKDLVQYLKDTCEHRFSKEAYDEYTFTKTHPEYNLLNEAFKSRIHRRIFCNTDERDFPVEWGISAMLRLQLEDAQYISSVYQLEEYLDRYYHNCKTLGKEPVITKNFMITIAHTEHLLETYKKEKMDELIKEHNDIPELYYENGTYIVRPLISRADFHIEAEAQHNCVERIYMEEVADGKTHVVVVRKKDNPSKSLLTCEISNKFRIQQYYAQCNSAPKRPEAIFFNELEAYLKNLQENKA